jgi:hypothetical protein
MWCSKSAIPVLRRLKEKDQEFLASLGYTGTPCLKTTTKKLKKIKLEIITLSPSFEHTTQNEQMIFLLVFLKRLQLRNTFNQGQT